MDENTKLARLNYKELKLVHLKRRIMTITNISYMLAKLMKYHIGVNNAIRMEDLFKAIYQTERKPDYVDDFRWDYVRKAMHKLRQSSKLFIIAIKSPTNTYAYFVPTNINEAQIYVNALENNIARQRQMQIKVMKSISEGWYNLDWIEENKTLLDYKRLVEQREQQQLK